MWVCTNYNRRRKMTWSGLARFTLFFVAFFYVPFCVFGTLGYFHIRQQRERFHRDGEPITATVVRKEYLPQRKADALTFEVRPNDAPPDSPAIPLRLPEPDYLRLLLGDQIELLRIGDEYFFDSPHLGATPTEICTDGVIAGLALGGFIALIVRAMRAKRRNVP